MSNNATHCKSEDGFVVVFVMMILIIVTILGTSSSRTALTQQKIARNEMLYKETFYNADSGPYTVAKLVSKTIDEKTAQTVGPNGDFNDFRFRSQSVADQAATDQGAVFNQIMGFEAYDQGEKDVFYENVFEVDIRRDKTAHVAGGAADFASGAEGIGAGSKGGIEIRFNLDADGLSDRTRPVNIIGIYLKVPDIAYGL